MENMEEIFHFLEDFSKRKPKVIPQELNEYLAYVARTGDPVYQWSLVKALFKEKLLNVITDFYETTPSIEIPPYPNVDPFNYDAMKNSLLERLDSFASAPFTVQRICELLTYPRKQYNRIDKFMRAVEKNILVVSTREPGVQRHAEPENGEQVEPIVNGSDNNSEYNVDVEMEDMSWKENAEQQQNAEPQPSSSETLISVDDIEARLQAKQDTSTQNQEKSATQYESVTPPELNIASDEQEMKLDDTAAPTVTTQVTEIAESNEPSHATESEQVSNPSEAVEDAKIDVEMKPIEIEKDPLIIPEIKVDDAEMTERRLAEESSSTSDKPEPVESIVEKEAQEEKQETVVSEEKIEESVPTPVAVDESSSDSNMKDEPEKAVSEVLTSSEESSSSSDNTDGNSNSPKPEAPSDSQESYSDSNPADYSDAETKPEPPVESKPVGDNVTDNPQIEADNYSISDVKSELPLPSTEDAKELEETKEEIKEPTETEPEEKGETQKTETPEVSNENLTSTP